jgi:hypothetical protein
MGRAPRPLQAPVQATMAERRGDTFAEDQSLQGSPFSGEELSVTMGRGRCRNQKCPCLAPPPKSSQF